MVFPFAAVISAANMARRNNENSKKKNKEQKEVNQKINKKPKDSKTVSRIIVSYDDGTITTQNNVVDYHTYGATPVTLPQDGVGGITIQNGGNPLQNWVKSDDSSDVDTDADTAGIQYDGFKNLAVTAVYDLSYEFEVTLPEYAKYELPAGNISVTFGLYAIFKLYVFVIFLNTAAFLELGAIIKFGV